jgi:superfamily II DNA helicase RecQ
MQMECRRKIILTHFGEILPINYSCQNCDNCNKQHVISQESIDNLIYPIFLIIKTIFYVKCKVGLNKLGLILKGSKSKIINEFNRCPTYSSLKELNDEQIKILINILIINEYLREKTIINGFGGTIFETTNKGVKWYTTLNKQIGNISLTYDNLSHILDKSINKIDLTIPIDYNHIIKNIKFKTTIDTMISEFSNDFI